MCMGFWEILEIRLQICELQVEPCLQFMSVRLQWATWDCSGASMFLFLSHVFWVGRTDTFLG